VCDRALRSVLEKTILRVGRWSPAADGVEMKKLITIFGLMIAISLGAIGWTAGSNVMAGEGQQIDACAPGEIALDEGYGVSRHIERVCPKP
jgi:hypothetical protein